ncbi:MAG TPA: DUF305 domain-containing protein [Gemmatimonadaceae bacterium]|nr:DUF305 domain-containing protein [Gemmatimonadaceae bacterium]
MRTATTIALLATVAAGSGMLHAQTPERMLGAPYHNPSRAFIDLMIPHHEMGLMMAEHAAMGVRSDTLKQMALRMKAEQTAELAELKALRRELFGSDSSRTDQMQAMMQMMGMHEKPDSAKARAMPDSMRMPPARPMPDSMRMPPQAPGRAPGAGGMPMMAGADLDRMFLEHAVAHHLTGADIAVLAEDSDAQARVKALARKIRQRQERDIADMRQRLAAMPATRAAPHDH